MCAALLYPLRPTYLGTWGYREGVRRLAAARELWPVAHIWQKKSNFKFGIYIYLCQNFIVFLLNLMYLYIKLRLVTIILKIQ